MNPSTQYYLRSAKSILRAIFKSRFWSTHSSEINGGVTIENDFFGINIAPSTDSSVDDFIIDRLQELGLRHVRMNFSYESLGGDAERLLTRVIAADFKVLLDLLPPFEEASNFNAEAQQRWADFLNTVADKYGDKVECIEIGSTPNRGRWSGFGVIDYLAAWRIACDTLKPKGRKHRVPALAGPNVSDFEPLYSIQLLSDMQLQSHPPDIHTNNMFVERVIEPEAFDHRVLGKPMTNILKLNLVKKARVMQAVGQDYGVESTICTYNCWTTKRLERWSAVPERKKADYLVRYLVIAAATGALSRVYWGPLICSRDGLIGDGSTDYPAIDNVTFYKNIRGELADFNIHEAFYAYRNLIKVLSGTTCRHAVNEANGIHHFIFDCNDGKQLHIAWTRDRGCIDAELLYTREQLGRARVLDIFGSCGNDMLLSFGERPVFMLFDQAESLTRNRRELLGIHSRPRNVAVGIDQNTRYQPWIEGHWRGFVAVKPGEQAKEKAQALLPEKLLEAPQLSTHRDQRNRVWSIQHPLQPDQIIVIKENRAKGVKKLTYRFKASKGQRHWDNAWEMLRRGINSPTPIAYFEQITNTGSTHNYYICEFANAAFSVREAFTAFSGGCCSFGDFSKEQIIKAVAEYSCLMHKKKIIHRDLSSGNLLVTTKNGDINITAIDIGRATIYLKREVNRRQRLSDIMRCCYKLGWPDRELFVSYYFAAYGRELPEYWRISLNYYDWKSKTKKKFKRLIKGKWKKAK